MSTKLYMEFMDKMQDFADQLPAVPVNHSPVFTFFQYWKKELFEKDAIYLEKYQQIVEAEKEAAGEKAPFLSVVIRTQGNRSEMLRETFLALYGQSDEDFEVILVKHKAQPENAAMVDEIVAEQPESLRCRIRTLDLNEGNRTAPINFGLAHAHGEYVVILDDDDIVFDHWVESFHKAAMKDGGCILHSYCVGQKWEILEDADGKQALRAAGTPDAIYCYDFNVAEEARKNRCPLMGLAFPGFLFREFGKVFDETLATTEDWDYLMRFAYLLGVVDIKSPTSIYRNFANGSNSVAMHKQSEWNQNYAKIIDKGRFMPKILMPADWHDCLITEAGLPEGAKLGKGEPPQFDHAALYVDYGEGFKENERLHSLVLNTASVFEAEYQMGDIEKPISRIRFDITEAGLFGIKDFYFSIEYRDGSVFMGDLDDVDYTNGCKYNDHGTRGIWFEGYDPQIEIRLDPDKSIRSIHFYGWRSHYLPIKELLKRDELGCICALYVKIYEGIYLNYFRRLRHFRGMIADFKKEEKLALTDPSKKDENRAAAIKECEGYYRDYRKYLEKALEKDMEWAKVHSRKGILRLNKIKMQLRTEFGR